MLKVESVGGRWRQSEGLDVVWGGRRDVKGEVKEVSKIVETSREGERKRGA